MSRRVENELRELLAARAASVPAEDDPYERTSRSIRRARWRHSLAVVLCVCVLAAAATPIAVFRPFTVRAPAPGVAWIQKDANGRAELFVLGPPDTQAMAYSPGVVFHPDGTWDRSWHQLRARDGARGVAHAAVVNPRPATDLLRLNLPRGRVVVPVGGGDRLPDGMKKQRVSEVLQSVSGAGDPGAASGGRTDGLHRALVALRRQTGIPAGEFEIRVRWHRDQQRQPSEQSQRGGRVRPGRQGWLLSATLPSGVTFQVVSLRGGSLGSHVVLVPQGAGGRPVAVAEPEPRRRDSGRASDGPAEDSDDDPLEAAGPAENSAAGLGVPAGTGQASGEGSRDDPGPYSEDSEDSEDAGDSEDSGGPGDAEDSQDSESGEPCPDFNEDPESWDDYGDDELPGGAVGPVTRVIAVAPGYSDGYAQLWLRGEKLATTPVDETGRAVFDDHLVECVIEDEEGEENDAYGVEDLRVRIVDGSGQEVYRGPVHGAGQPPPWNRPYQ